MHIYMVEFLNLNDHKKCLTGMQRLKTGGCSNIKIVQWAPDFFKISQIPEVNKE